MSKPLNHHDQAPIVWNKVINTKVLTNTQALKKGYIVETVKKEVKNDTLGTVAARRKLDNPELDNVKHPKITTEFKTALANARMKLGWSQMDLAQKINVKSAIIRDYESGKAIPQGALIHQLNRVLNITLPKIEKKKKEKQED